MAAPIVPLFSNVKVEEQPIELQRDANLRFQGKILGSGSLSGEIIFEGTEGRPPGVTPSPLDAEFLPIDLTKCGVHGLTGGAKFSGKKLTIKASPATFLVNIALPFRFMQCTYIPASGGAGIKLSVIVGARP